MSLASTGSSASDRQRATAFLILTAVLWSFGGLLIKQVSWNPIAIAGARSAIAAALLLAVTRRPQFTWSFAQLGAAVAYTVTVILFVAANKLTTAANAILLQYTSPIYAALLGAWFLGERTAWLDWATIAVTLGGMVLFFFDKLTPGGMWGNLCSMLSGVTFAGLVILLRQQRHGSPLESVILGNGLTALVGLPFVVGTTQSVSNWAILLVLGTVQLGLPYLLYSAAIKHVTAVEAILTAAIEPILNPLWVFLWMRERPGPWALVGGSIVLACVTGRGILSAALYRRRRARAA